MLYRMRLKLRSSRIFTKYENREEDIIKKRKAHSHLPVVDKIIALSKWFSLWPTLSTRAC
jgi:hypothetical protein